MNIQHLYAVYICIHMYLNSTKGTVVTKTTLLISEGYFNRCNLFTPFYLFLWMWLTLICGLNIQSQCSLIDELLF